MLFGLGVIGGINWPCFLDCINVDSPNIDIDSPDIDIDGPSIDIDGPNIDIDGPNIDIDGPNIDIDGPNINGGVWTDGNIPNTEYRFPPSTVT